MTHGTERPDAVGGRPLADVYWRSAVGLDSAEELLQAHLGGQQLGDEAKASISRSLTEALYGLYSLQAAAERGTEDARHARDGLRRFDTLLRQIAEAGLLPER